MTILNKEAMQLIKLKARAIHLTQEKAAKELKVSLPTIKRWWNGEGLNLDSLHALCRLVGISLSELFLEIEGGALRYSYTIEQEKMLAANPRALALFDLLVSGHTIEYSKKQYGLSDLEIVPMLVKLDRVNLIELHPKNHIRLKQKGEPQWIVDGPLSLKYRKRMIETFLGEHPKRETTFYIHDYLPEDLILLKGKISELERLMETCNSRASAREDSTKSYGVYLSIKPFEWNIRDVLRSAT